MNRFFNNFTASPFKVYAALTLVPLLLFSKSLYYGFSPMDENWLITGNTQFLHDWSNLIQSFKGQIQKVYFRPLLINTFLIDYQIGELNPFVYHLTNIILHILSVLLLYKFLLRLSIGKDVAFVLSLLFSVHPLVIHAVIWVPGRNDVLLCVFFLAAAICLLIYLEKRKPYPLVLHFLFFLAAMLTKESAVAFPLIFLGLILLRSSQKKDFIYFSSAWVLVFLTWFYLRQQVLHDFSIESRDLISTARNFLLSLLVFTGKAILPVSQSVSPVVGNSMIWLNAIIVAVFAVVCFVIGIKDKKLAAFGMLSFYAVLFLPVWFGAQTTLGEQYEHRAYTALVGLILFLSQVNFNYQSILFKAALALVVIIFTLKTASRQEVYKSEMSYLDEGIRDCPRNYFFHSQKGILLYMQKRFSDALPYMDRAIEIYPGQAKLHNNRGNVHFEMGHKKETLYDYTRALQLSDYKPSIYFSRCLAYKKFGEIEKAKEDMEAIKIKDPSLITPSLEKEINSLWMDHKIESLTQQISKDPGNARLYVDRAQIFFYLRKGSPALADLKKATELEPGNKQYKAYYEKLSSTYPHKQGS